MAENKEHSSLRLAYIDIAKALGLCLVILSHTVYPRLMFFALGCFVPVFFVASSYTTQTINLKKKAKRLLLPYVLFNIGLIVLFIIKQIYISSTEEGIFENIGGILYSRYAVYPLNSENNVFLMQAGNAPMWFLTSMFTAYVALKPLLVWPKLRGGIICVYLMLTWLLSKLPILLPWSLDTAFLMTIFIYAGVKLRETNLLSNNNWRLWCCILLAYYIVSHINGYENLSIRDYGDSILLCLISGILGSCLIMKFSIWIASFAVGKHLARIGRYTLTIFCIQMPLLVGSRMIIEKISSCLSLTIPLVCIALCQLVITISLGYAIALIARKIFPNLL